MGWTSFDGFIDQVPFQNALSISDLSESERTAMSDMEAGDNSGAEDDAGSPRRRRKPRMDEVDEVTQSVSHPAKFVQDENIVLFVPAPTGTE